MSDHETVLSSPALFLYRCTQCVAEFTAVVFDGPDGQDLAVLSNVAGGLTTTNTPRPVAFYLDQAARSRSVGARSAAAAMYRAALEHLLYEQGFKGKEMLGSKLKTLDKAIAEGKAPPWAMQIDTDVLGYLKDIGNGAIHANEGDLSFQEEISPEALSLIEEAFTQLLAKVYEEPARQAAAKARMKELADKTRAKPQPASP